MSPTAAAVVRRVCRVSSAVWLVVLCLCHTGFSSQSLSVSMCVPSHATAVTLSSVNWGFEPAIRRQTASNNNHHNNNDNNNWVVLTIASHASPFAHSRAPRVVSFEFGPNDDASASDASAIRWVAAQRWIALPVVSQAATDPSTPTPNRFVRSPPVPDSGIHRFDLELWPMVAQPPPSPHQPLPSSPSLNSSSSASTSSWVPAFVQSFPVSSSRRPVRMAITDDNPMLRLKPVNMLVWDVPVCSSPPELANGWRTCSGGVCEFQCDSGYVLTHTRQMLCDPTDGQWYDAQSEASPRRHPVAPQCHLVTCDAPEPGTIAADDGTELDVALEVAMRGVPASSSEHLVVSLSVLSAPGRMFTSVEFLPSDTADKAPPACSVTNITTVGPSRVGPASDASCDVFADVSFPWRQLLRCGFVRRDDDTNVLRGVVRVSVETPSSTAARASSTSRLRRTATPTTIPWTVATPVHVSVPPSLPVKADVATTIQMPTWRPENVSTYIAADVLLRGVQVGQVTKTVRSYMHDHMKFVARRPVVIAGVVSSVTMEGEAAPFLGHGDEMAIAHSQSEEGAVVSFMLQLSASDDADELMETLRNFLGTSENKGAQQFASFVATAARLNSRKRRQVSGELMDVYVVPCEAPNAQIIATERVFDNDARLATVFLTTLTTGPYTLQDGSMRQVTRPAVPDAAAAAATPQQPPPRRRLGASRAAETAASQPPPGVLQLLEATDGCGEPFAPCVMRHRMVLSPDAGAADVACSVDGIYDIQFGLQCRETALDCPLPPGTVLPGLARVSVSVLG